MDGDPGNDPALLPSGVTIILDLDVETLGPLSVGVLIRSGDSTVLSSGGFALNDIGIVERSRFGGFFRGGGFWRTGGGCFGSGGAVLAITLSLISLARSACLKISCALNTNTQSVLTLYYYYIL